MCNRVRMGGVGRARHDGGSDGRGMWSFKEKEGSRVTGPGKARVRVGGGGVRGAWVWGGACEGAGWDDLICLKMSI